MDLQFLHGASIKDTFEAHYLSPRNNQGASFPNGSVFVSKSLKAKSLALLNVSLQSLVTKVTPLM